MDKQPGVQPIGIDEVLRYIIGKIVMKILKSFAFANGSLQLCERQDVGNKAAIHAVYEMLN